MLPATINAATIVGLFNPSSPGLESINLTTTGSLNWATLEATGFKNTKAGGSSAFSNIAVIGGGSLSTGGDASTQMAWSNGSPTAAASAYRNFVYAFPFDTVGVGVSFKYTLEAPTVSMTIYLIDYDGGGSLGSNNTNLFSASLSSGATFTQTVSLGNGFDDDHGKGWFDLTVTGSVGDHSRQTKP